MSKRNSEYARKPGDRYDTPPEPVDALISVLDLPLTLWEPCPGAGKLVARLRQHGFNVREDWPEDFLAPEVQLPSKEIGAVLTNPPFRIAGEFIRKALQLLAAAAPPRMLVLLLPTDFDHAARRIDLFRDCPLFMGQVKLTRRIVWFERADGKRPAPSENHSWFVWSHDHTGAPWVRYATWPTNGAP